jgi:hypothetical protein
MCKKVWRLAILLLGISMAACGQTADDQSIPTNTSSVVELPTDTPEPITPTPEEITPTPSPYGFGVSIHPEDTRMGIAEVDAVIEAFLSNDVEAKISLVEYITEGCVVKDSLGGPPDCELGMEVGTPMTYFPVLNGELSYADPENMEGVMDFEVHGLYAVYQSADDKVGFQFCAYCVVFQYNDMGFLLFVGVNDAGKMTYFRYTLGEPYLEIQAVTGDFLLPPP